ncbi:HlyD family efflux transporter periplasmic adaptor subunit [Propioniciclava sp.]|uniref:HlyD family efflux transporter periplasmic adaptor subunit n=1 Tax=Propioniciclava sp. TaxID=2038686 RepID=UPI00261883CC|nr:HlyD family efflux transporter periplasmic adaptor subunit [Propioniciclava sp.]
MTWSNRLRLWGGVLAVLILMFALTLLFNQRQARVASLSAQVDAPTAVVGSSFGGVLTELKVSEGQEVKAGDELFKVVSPDLQTAVSNGQDPESTPAYNVDIPSSTITYLAVIDGQVTDLSATLGSYFVPGSSLATISATTPKTVVAVYDLEPVDFGRVERGADVTINLADNSQVAGTVSDVTVSTEDGNAITEVRITSDGLSDAQYADLTKAGAPVNAVMNLRDDGIFAGPTAAMMQFLTKIGLR